MSNGAVSSGGRAALPLNIVFAGNFLYPRGMAGTKRVQHFIDSTVAVAGNTAQVLLFRQSHAGRDESRLAGDYHGVPYVTIGHDVKSDWRLPFTLLRYIWKGCAWLRRWRVRGSHCNMLFLYGEPNIESVLFVLFARLSGYRVVVDVVEDSYEVGGDAPLGSRIKAWTAGQASRRMHWFADAVIVISTHLQRKFSALGRGRFDVKLIPISVDLRKIPAREDGFNRPVRIFYAGSFAEKDGVENLIAAFEIVADRQPEIELQLTGMGMEERMQEILRRIDASPVKKRMHYLGYLSDDDYFAAVGDCDVPCVIRVDSDFADRGFPFKLGEYLATGRPVIASAIGDIPDFLADRRSAYLVKAGDIDAVARAMEYIVSHEADAVAVGQAGRKVAEENFDAAMNGARFVRLLQAVCR